MRIRAALLCIMISPLITRAQLSDISGESDSKQQTSSTITKSILADEAIEEISDSTPSKYLSEKPERNSLYPYSDLFNSDFPVKSEYIASVDIMEVLRPAGTDDRGDKNAEFIFGVKRPYYRLGENIRCVGVVDLKMAKSIAGCDNSLIIAFGYDIKKDIHNRAIETRMSIVNVGFKVTIPLSLR